MLAYMLDLNDRSQGEKETTRGHAKTTTTERPRPTTTTRRFSTTTERSHVTHEQPTHEHGGNGDCPSRIDAYTPGPGSDILFDGSRVFMIDGKRVTSSSSLSTTFPGGPSSVNAAVYDKDKEFVVLFSGRQVYAYKKAGWAYKLDSQFPKDLPDSVAFSPNAAITWHDGHQMVLSNGGMFALYDEYWNKSLMTGRSSTYFEGLPDGTKGISSWNNGRSSIFTRSLVFEYSKDHKGTVGDGSPISAYFRC